MTPIVRISATKANAALTKKGAPASSHAALGEVT